MKQSKFYNPVILCGPEASNRSGNGSVCRRRMFGLVPIRVKNAVMAEKGCAAHATGVVGREEEVMARPPRERNKSGAP